MTCPPLLAAFLIALAGPAAAQSFCHTRQGGAHLVPVTWCVSSALKSSGMLTYGPANLGDSDPRTAWCEGVPGLGAGQEIALSIDARAPFDALEIHNGYQKTEKLYEQNARPRRIEIVTDDGETTYHTLSDDLGGQILPLPGLRRWHAITIRILDSYRGSKYADTCISGLVPHFPGQM